MVAIRRHANPVEGAYVLCDQAVTVYHRSGKDAITRTVHASAFLDERKNLNVEKTGASEANAFLLVIPGSTQAVEVGDKVLRGEGPEIETDAAWAALVPAKVAGLVVVKYVDVKRYGGQIVHTEAGG